MEKKILLSGLLLAGLLLPCGLTADMKSRGGQTFGSDKDEEMATIQPVPGRGVIAGGWFTSQKTNRAGRFHRQFWVIRLDTQGNKQWDLLYGKDGDEVCTALTVERDGGCVAVGYTTEGVSNGSRPMLLRISGRGRIRMFKQYSSSGYSEARAVAPLGNGYLLGGVDGTEKNRSGWLRRLDRNGNELWKKKPVTNGKSAVLDLYPLKSGGALLAGWVEPADSRSRRGWLARLDPSGKIVWQRILQEERRSELVSITANNSGDIAAVGNSSLSNSQPDMLVAGFDGAGKQQWLFNYGGRQLDRANRVINSGNGGYIVAGQTASYGNGSLNGWLMMLNTQGEKVWAKLIGGKKTDTLAGVASYKPGLFAAAATTRSFGKGGSDMLIVFMQRFGEEVWDKTPGSGGVFSMLQLEDRGFVISGVRRQAVSGKQLPVPIVEKLNSSGDRQWQFSEQFGGTGYTVFQLTNGDLLAAGRINRGKGFRPLVVRISTNGKKLAAYSYPAGIEMDSSFLGGCRMADGGFVLTGFVKTGWYLTRDLLVCRYDRNGKLLWHRILGGKRDEVGFAAVEAPDGGVIIGGVNYSKDRHGEGYLIRFDRRGEISWEETFGSRGFDSVSAVVKADKEKRGILFCGTSGKDEDSRLWVGGVSWQGKLLWEKRYGSDEAPAVGSGLKITADQSYLAYGTRSDNLYLVKVSAEGRLVWDRVYGSAAKELGTAVLIAKDGTTVTAAVRYTAEQPVLWLKKWF